MVIYWVGGFNMSINKYLESNNEQIKETELKKVRLD